MSWLVDAACTQVDPDIMFPDTNLTSEIRRAQKVCAGCPVAAECLADTPVWDRFSVRGGLTGRMRRELRAKQRKEAAA